MIFVTVGSRNYPFDRLFRKLDELVEDGTIKDKIFAQIGTSIYKPKNFEYKDFVSPEEFEKYINKADIVVSHGASGSIMKALNADKKVIVVTRLEKYGEAFANNHYVLMADLELNDLGHCFKKINSKENGLVKWENKDPMAIVNMIDKFIEDNWK